MAPGEDARRASQDGMRTRLPEKRMERRRAGLESDEEEELLANFALPRPSAEGAREREGEGRGRKEEQERRRDAGNGCAVYVFGKSSWAVKDGRSLNMCAKDGLDGDDAELIPIEWH